MQLLVNVFGVSSVGGLHLGSELFFSQLALISEGLVGILNFLVPLDLELLQDSRFGLKLLLSQLVGLLQLLLDVLVIQLAGASLLKHLSLLESLLDLGASLRR